MVAMRVLLTCINESCALRADAACEMCVSVKACKIRFAGQEELILVVNFKLYLTCELIIY